MACESFQDNLPPDREVFALDPVFVLRPIPGVRDRTPRAWRDFVEDLTWTSIVMDFTRPGSDFFHSLTHGHTEILQVPGTILMESMMFDITHGRGPSELNWMSGRLDGLFDSRENDIHERWGHLGQSQKESFRVNREAFEDNFIYLLSDLKKPSVREWFVAFHVAYAFASGFDVNKAQLLLFHLHYYRDRHLYELKNDTVYLMMTRDIREGIASSLFNRPQSHPNYAEPRVISNLFHHYVFMPQYLAPNARNVIIPLRSLHRHPVEIMQSFASHFGLNWESNLLQSSYFGLLWWGDSWSVSKNGFNPDFGNSVRRSRRLARRDVLALDFLFAEEFYRLGYPSPKHSTPRLLRILAGLVLSAPPASFEIWAFRIAFAKATGLSAKWLAIQGFVVGWGARIAAVSSSAVKPSWTYNCKAQIWAFNE